MQGEQRAEGQGERCRELSCVLVLCVLLSERGPAGDVDRGDGMSGTIRSAFAISHCHSINVNYLYLLTTLQTYEFRSINKISVH